MRPEGSGARRSGAGGGARSGGGTAAGASGGRGPGGEGAHAAGKPHVFGRGGAGLPEAGPLDPQHLRAAGARPQDPAQRLARGGTLLSGATGQPRDSGCRDRVRSGARGGMGEALISPEKTQLPSCALLPP